MTVTRTGLDPGFKFFNTGGDKLVYCPLPIADKLQSEFGERANVIGLPSTLDLGLMLDDLGERGISRLMVESGREIHTQFLTQDLADEIQLAVAPFFVGDADAFHFVNTGAFPQNSSHRMTVAEVRLIGDVVFTRYTTGRGDRT